MKPASNVIKVSIVEDNVKILNSILELLSLEKDVECIGVYGDAETALIEIPKLPPQILLLDINLPGMSGLECVRILSPQLPHTQILMLTVRHDPRSIFEALANGAHGYLLKPFRSSQLSSALRDATGGEPMRHALAKHVLNFFGEATPQNQGPQIPIEGLSPRETEILKYLVAGHAYKQIAGALNIAYGTVHVHIARIYKKMHVQSRGQAVAKVLGQEQKFNTDLGGGS